MTEVLEDVLADLMGGVEIDPHRQGKRDEGGFFGTPHNPNPTESPHGHFNRPGREQRRDTPDDLR